MEKRLLGSLEVSALGYGAMGLSHAYGAPLDEGEALRVLNAAFDAGYTFIDTAEVYGPYLNEKLVGKAFASRRDKVQIATKCGIRLAEHDHGLPLPDSSPDFIRASLEGSLKRLNTSYIDLYYLHRIDPGHSPEEVADLMASFIKEGKILHYGIYEVSEDYLRRAHAVCPVTAIQNRYSMMYRNYETLFPVLEELNVGFVAFSPLANGFLSGAYPKGTHFDPHNDYRSRMVQFTDASQDRNAEFIAFLDSLAKKYSATPSQLALAWLLERRPYIVPIHGSRSAERLKENAQAADLNLSAADMAALTGALESLPLSEVFGGTKG